MTARRGLGIDVGGTTVTIVLVEPDGRVVAAREEPTALAMGLTILVNVLNPEVIAVGGGVAEAGAAFLDRLRASVRAAAWAPASEVVRLVPTALGTRAGAIGAAVFAAGRSPRC